MKKSCSLLDILRNTPADSRRVGEVRTSPQKPYVHQTGNHRYEEGQALFLDLAKRYLWLSSDFYFMNLLKALEHLVSEYEKLTSDTKVYVMMLIAPKDEGKTKSSAMLLYLFNDTRLRIDPRFSHYRFEIISDKESLHQKMD